MPFDSEKETTVPVATPDPALERTPSSDECVAEASLPKLVVCFDISTLSLENLKAIALDLKLPDYNSMTKEQLCEALIGDTFNPDILDKPD